MEKIKVMCVFGTRPEATKMIPVIKELQKSDKIQTIVCVTAQHRQMLDQVLQLFDVVPDYDLNIMKHKQTLKDIAVNAMNGLDDVFKEAKPDIVLVHGDTSTTFAGGLCAFYNQIKVGHVEAGLRTYNKLEPFPEELHRVLTGHIADLHFAPTSLSKDNLLKENITENIYVTGNTSIDCLKETVKEDYKFSVPLLNEIDYKNKRVIAMTAHRRENIGEPLENICNAVLEIVNEYEDVEVVYAVHFNPVVQQTVRTILGGHDRIHLIDPIDLFDMHNLTARSYLVMTDSGGLQEEVPSLDKPVLVLRNVTERPEGVDAGTLKLAGTDKDNIIKEVKNLLDNKDEYEKMQNAVNPFGDGNTSARIVSAILHYFGMGDRPEDWG